MYIEVKLTKEVFILAQHVLRVIVDNYNNLVSEYINVT